MTSHRLDQVRSPVRLHRGHASTRCEALSVVAGAILTARELLPWRVLVASATTSIVIQCKHLHFDRP